MQRDSDSWQLAARVLTDQATEEDRRALAGLVNSSDEAYRWFEEVQEIWDGACGDAASVDTDAAWEEVRRRMEGRHGRDARRARAPLRRQHSRWLVSAAVVSTLVIGALAYFLVLGEPSEPDSSASVAETARGERSIVRLADGSRVILNGESAVVVEHGFGSTHRNVRLEGEAMFDVLADQSLPFTVEAAGKVVEVTGTRFVVSRYRDAPFFVAVEEGAVKISDYIDELIVEGGWLAHVHDGGLVPTRILDPDVYFGWTEGRLVFRHTPLEVVISRLERWHDVDIQLDDPTIGRLRLTTNFEGNTIDDALEVISSALGVGFIRRGDAYVLHSSDS